MPPRNVFLKAWAIEISSVLNPQCERKMLVAKRRGEMSPAILSKVAKTEKDVCTLVEAALNMYQTLKAPKSSGKENCNAENQDATIVGTPLIFTHKGAGGGI